MVALFMLKEVVCEGGLFDCSRDYLSYLLNDTVEEVQVDGRYAVQIQGGEGRKVGVNG